MNVAVVKNNGEDTGRKVKLSKEIFSIEPNDHAIYLDVTQYLANQRQGTHKSKERGEVAGSTRKVKRQKGTGTARFGDIKNPIFRGGGRIFGPRPRDHGIKLNKKLKTLAKKSVLSDKVSNGNLVVLEDFTFDEPKTSEFVNVLNSLSLGDEKVLFVTGDQDKVLYLSSRNYKKAKVTDSRNINTYDILDAKKLILCESSVETIIEALTNS